MSVVPKRQRKLLVVTCLSVGGDPKYQGLYQWLDASTVALARMKLTKHYRRIYTLTGANATAARFVSRVTSLARSSSTRALDVILAVHGLRSKLYFRDGMITSRTLGNRLQAKNLGSRLRLLYSLVCYGMSHAQDFVDAGFRTASGSRKINANSPYDFPHQLEAWADGYSYKRAVNSGNRFPMRLVFDTLAKTAGGFPANQVDSYKIIKGKKMTSIKSSAT